MNSELGAILLAGGARLQLVRGDITTEKTDCIVNAANPYLQHGGGVASAISEAGGGNIQEESDAWVREHGLVNHTMPARTSGGRLKCKAVLHAVGPVWDDSLDEAGRRQKEAELGSAVSGCLQAAEELGMHSIALPAISTGIFGFPAERAAGIHYQTIRTYFETNPASGIRLIRMVVYDAASTRSFIRTWHDHFST